jgi:hypothetical protein
MYIPLRPVDGLRVTTLIDNSSDALLPDEGLVRRWGLSGSAGPLPIVTALAAESPGVLVPGHCTSWQAMHLLAREMPDAFRPNAVGSEFHL